jgi:uncharacterized membrane protein YgcG
VIPIRVRRVVGLLADHRSSQVFWWAASQGMKYRRGVRDSSAPFALAAVTGWLGWLALNGASSVGRRHEVELTCPGSSSIHDRMLFVRIHRRRRSAGGSSGGGGGFSGGGGSSGGGASGSW